MHNIPPLLRRHHVQSTVSIGEYDAGDSVRGTASNITLNWLIVKYKYIKFPPF